MMGEERPAAAPITTASDSGQEDPFGGLRPGTQVGKYEIVEMLGQGGFGITYRARDSQLRRDVAIKEYLPTSFAVRQGGTTVLPRSTQTADDFRWGRERFLDEARTLATLEDAPGIVNVYDFMEANGTAYMVMGLVRGETVEARLKRDGRLPQPAIEQLVYPLLDGLERVHAAGFLHRDIKPANILLDGNGRPTLIDFGASRVALQGRTQALTAVYTPGYAAFEQSTSARQGPWTDIYALAATIYHCITGAPPPSAIDRMIDDRLVPAADAGKGRYAPSLLAAIDSGLKLKPTERPQTIAQWRQVLSGTAHSAGHASPDDTRRMEATPRISSATLQAAAPAQSRKRMPVAWIAAGFVALAIAGGGAWLALRPGEDRTAMEGVPPPQTDDAQARKAAEDARAAEEEAARKTAQEKAAAEAAQRQADEQARADAAARQQAEAEEARRRAEAEARAAEAQARAEADAKRQAEAAETALHLSEQDRKRVQVALSSLGYGTQGADGTFGPRTRQMIAAWQKSQGTPETGYLTAGELAALRQQAASALARYEEEQRKIEDDKRRADADAKRQQEEDARKRAEEDQRRQAPPPAPVAVAPPPSAASADGSYYGEHCSGLKGEEVTCRAVGAVVTGGVGSFRWRVGRCGSNMFGSATFKIDPAGALTGTVTGFNERCQPSGGQIWGQYAAGRITIQSRGNLRANLMRK